METRKKIELAEVDSMKMNIELANNGIIIRQNLNALSAMLAVGTGLDGAIRDCDQEHQAIGRYIFNWLMTVRNKRGEEHQDDFFITNFDIEVRCKCQGEEV